MKESFPSKREGNFWPENIFAGHKLVKRSVSIQKMDGVMTDGV